MPTSAGNQTFSYSDLRKLWIKAGGNRAWSYVMAAVAMAESRGNPHAHHVDSNGSVDWGLWQINSVHFSGDVNAQTMQDPNANAREAVKVFNSSGPDAWSTYKSGAYKAYMPGGKSDPSGGGDIWNIFRGAHSVDQGVDWPGKGQIPALDSAVVTDVGHVHIIEGGTWPEIVYRLTAGPNKGRYVYTMENINPEVHKGQHLQKGDPIAAAKGQYPYFEIGFNRQPQGINPVSPLGSNPHAPTPAGFAMQTYIAQDVAGSGGGGINLPSVGTVVGDLTNPVGAILGAGGSALKDFFGNPLSGVESLIMQGFFILVGIGLVVVGLALVAWTVMGKVGAPGVIGMAQSQMRIRQSGARIQESSRAATAREELRAQSLAETQRASQVRESQASRRLSEQRQKRKLSQRRLEVREQGVARRNPPERKFMDVKRDDRTAAPKKPGKKVSGPPRKK